jgi:hypothetical protein
MALLRRAEDHFELVRETWRISERRCFESGAERGAQRREAIDAISP